MQQKVVSGLWLFPRLKNYLCKLRVRKILLIRGKQSYISSGLEEALKPVLEHESPEAYKVISFFDFAENPQYEDLIKGLEIARSFNPDIIIAAGGGSVLDMGKLIRFFLGRELDVTNYSASPSDNVIPLVAIPTTAGSGAEATHFSVLYKDKIKHSIAHKDILPDCVLLEPRFTYSLSPYQTACTGFDAFAQAVESYWSVNANKESEKIAWKALKIAYKILPLLIKKPTPGLRNKMLKASYLAGKAINITKTTAPHAFSYYFTMEHGIPHGQAVAITFPFFLEANWINNSNEANGKLDIRLHHKKMIRLYNLITSKNRKQNLPETSKIEAISWINKIGLTSQTLEVNVDLFKQSISTDRLKNNPLCIESVSALYNYLIS